MSQEIKDAITEAKLKISELDLLIAEMDGEPNRAILEDSHTPTNGQPYIYGFLDSADRNSGVIVPTGTIGLRSGFVRIDSDSTFICTGFLAVQQSVSAGIIPPAGIYWTPTSKAHAIGASFNLCRDFGWRMIDEGTGRKLFQAEDTDNVEQFIPGKFLGPGMPFEDYIGPNYDSPLSYGHVFAKNTSIRLDLNIYDASLGVAGQTRIHVGLSGYKIYGD